MSPLKLLDALFAGPSHLIFVATETGKMTGDLSILLYHQSELMILIWAGSLATTQTKSVVDRAFTVVVEWFG